MDSATKARLKSGSLKDNKSISTAVNITKETSYSHRSVFNRLYVSIVRKFAKIVLYGGIIVNVIWLLAILLLAVRVLFYFFNFSSP